MNRPFSPKPLASAAAVAFVAATGAITASATEPVRQSLPMETRELADSPMHRHLDDLLDIAAALRKGDYDKAADIADKHLGVRTSGGKSKGPASDMRDPQNIWELGLTFREAASRFATHARIVKRSESPEAKAALLDSFTKMLGICHDCHEVNRAN